MSNQPHEFNTGGEKTNSIEEIHRTQAIAYGHRKLLDAQMKDTALDDADAAGTHKYSPLYGIELGGVPTLRARTTLVPSADYIGNKAIKRIDIWFPTIKWVSADALLQDLHQRCVTTFTERGHHKGSDTGIPHLIPTLNMFGKIYHSSGEDVRFLITPSEASSYDITEEIIPVKDFNPKEPEYSIEHRTLFTAENERRFHEWINIEELGNLINRYEPTIHGNGESIDSVA